MNAESFLKIPLNLSLSLGHSSTGNSISNRAAQILSSLQSNFGSRRDAVVRKVDIILDHRFEKNFLTEPTFCSQCHEIIWGLVGQECRLCKMASHRKCLGSITSRCVNNHSSRKNLPDLEHCFEPNYFLSPTFCDHCGTMLVGITSRQGLECSTKKGGCGMSIHYDCKARISISCSNFSAQRNLCELSGGVSEEPDANHNEDKVNWSKMSIDQFELLGLLGTGTFSKVYLATLKSKPDAGRFAVKAIKKTTLLVSSDSESAFTEMRVLNKGRQYPFLAIAHCCFQSQDRLFYVMEHVVGRDLLVHLRRARKFTEDRTRFHSAEIVLAIRFLHKQGIVYRDLKLENVILERNGHCKLLDFGLSKELYKTESMRTASFCGTPGYISPETIKEQEYGFSVDWWAMGIMMYEMLVGYSPYIVDGHVDELYEMIVSEEAEIPGFLSDRARSILDGFLTKSPQNRLGCRILEDCEQAILDHPFFLFKTDAHREDHRWDAIEAQRMSPPQWQSPSDRDELDKKDEVITLTPVDSTQMKKISQQEFDGFSMYSESFKSLAGLNID